MRLNKIKDKKCKNCGVTFTPFKPLQPVCSNKCEIEYKNKKHKSKEIKPFPSKHKPISQMSKKMKGELAIYKPIRDQYMKDNPVCECCNDAESLDLHHVMGRIGYADENARLKGLKLLWDKRHFMAVCRSCHNEIHHEDPKWAREQGYLNSK